MSTLKCLGIAAATLVALASGATAQNARELIMTPGKGVSFYMGTKHGVTHFLSANGACQLTVAIGDSPDMDGMNPSTSTRISMTVVPGQPAKVETTDGEALMLACAPGGGSMYLVMPPGFKLKDGN